MTYGDAVYTLEAVRKQRNAMRDALQQVLRCPGIDTTDQATGETFRTLVLKALEAK